MSEVLFVCRRNLIRSKLAAAIWNAETGSQEASSAGLRPKRLHPLKTHRVHNDMREILAQDGIAISRRELRPHKLTEKQAQEAGRLVLLTSSENLPDFVKQHPHLDSHPVKDPNSRTELEYTYYEIQEVVAEVLAEQVV